MSEHGHIDPSNKKIAVLIAVLALVLAISETLSKAYQTEVITKQVEASDLWAFFQAKSVRSTVTIVALETAQANGLADDPKAADTIAKWKNNVKRYDSEPETGEGRKELAARKPSPHRMPIPAACGSPMPRASNGATVTTAHIGTCSTNGWMW